MLSDRCRPLVVALALTLGRGVAHAAEPTTLAPDLQVRELQRGVWLHVSKRDDGVAANGLVVDTPGGLLLVDTPWTEAQTDVLVPWAEKTLGRKLAKAVVTHWHADRTGGAPALYRRNIPVAAVDLTVEKLRDTPKTRVPEVLFAAKSGHHADPMGFEVFHPGHGHTFDSIVVWLPAQRLLFGGCLVKAEEATDMGYVAEADLAHWPAAIASVAKRYATAKTVIPGHGEPGSLRTLDRTTELIRAHVAKPPKR